MTTIPDIDVWRAARLMVQQHGDEAIRQAEQRAAELEEAGDADGHTVWLRIAAAVEELRRAPRQDEAVN